MKGHTYSKRRPYPFAWASRGWQERGALLSAYESTSQLRAGLSDSKTYKRALRNYTRSLPPMWRP